MKTIKLWEVESVGTYDDFYDTDKYTSYEEAKNKNDFIISDFVEDDDKIKYIKIYKSNDIKTEMIYKLNYQNIIAGIDIEDDNNVYKIALKMLKNN